MRNRHMGEVKYLAQSYSRLQLESLPPKLVHAKISAAIRKDCLIAMPFLGNSEGPAQRRVCPLKYFYYSPKLETTSCPVLGNWSS
jgi:hypothetical protein